MKSSVYLQPLEKLRAELTDYVNRSEREELLELAGIHTTWLAQLEELTERFQEYAGGLIGQRLGAETDKTLAERAADEYKQAMEYEQKERYRIAHERDKAQAKAVEMRTHAQDAMTLLQWLHANGHLPEEVASEMSFRQETFSNAANGDWLPSWEEERARRQQRVNEVLTEIKALLDQGEMQTDKRAEIILRLNELRGAIQTGVLPDEWPVVRKAPREIVHHG